MTTPLLKTKLHAPPVRPKLVQRRPLIERLNSDRDWKLALVCAPAGFGKTTLLSEWIVGGGSHTHIAWLSLDQQDNDPRRLLMSIVACLQSIPIGMSEYLSAVPSSQQSDDLNVLLTRLINQILTGATPFALVLDDYHVIHDPRVHGVLTYLLDHLPQNMHLVIATRSDPPLRLAQRRARGELCEIRAQDLRFTVDEATHFLNQCMGLALSPSEVAILSEKTEGWIAGLQLAAISLRTHPDRQAFFSAFAGDDRHIVDYLLDEVLDQQTAQIQTFLMETSILDQFCAPLCDAVTGGSHSQVILEDLERNNLFLVPLDHQRNWYRYHHLFGELLRARLRRAEGDVPAELYRRGSAWYEQQQVISEAVKLALLADDTQRVAQLMEGHLLAIVSTSELSVMNQLLASLPKETIRRNPWLAVAMAWGKAYVWQLESVEPILEMAKSALTDLDQVTRHWLEGRILVLQSYVAGCRAEYRESIRIAQDALKVIPVHDLTMRSFAVLIIGNAHRHRGNLELSIAFHTEALRLSEEGRDAILSVIIMARLVDLNRLTGHLNGAYKIGAQALQMVEQYQEQTGRPSFVLGYLQLRLTGAYYERNDLGMAMQLNRAGLDLVRQWGAYDSTSLGYFNLARVHGALGSYPDAISCLREFKETLSSAGHRQYRIASAIEAEIRIRAGDLQRASEWMTSCGPDSKQPIQFQDYQFFDVLAQVLVARGDLSEARALLEQLLTIAEESGAVEYQIRTLGRMALVLRKQGSDENAVDTLARALDLAATEGYQRAFLDQGESMAQLLYLAALRGIRSEFCNQLLTHFPSPTEPGAVPQDGLIESLSDREVQVLELIAEGLTNQEVAQALFLSLYTIKSHARNIFGKLGVKNRTEAVAKARLLGLLP